MEIWKDIAGYEGYYRVSNHGNVYSIRSKKVLSKYLVGKRGYHAVSLTIDGCRQMSRVHRLVAIAFLPNRYNLPEVHHIDENKLNNRLDNLMWVTTQQNCELSQSKHYKFVSPDGIITEVFNLHKFARDNNLCASHLCSVNNGQRKSHKGWKAF